MRSRLRKVSEMLGKVATNASAHGVWGRLLRNDPMFILDVRNRDEFERWRVEGSHRVPMFNIPCGRLRGSHTRDSGKTVQLTEYGCICNSARRGRAPPLRISASCLEKFPMINVSSRHRVSEACITNGSICCFWSFAWLSLGSA
jgi:hypothetical protein